MENLITPLSLAEKVTALDYELKEYNETRQAREYTIPSIYAVTGSKIGTTNPANDLREVDPDPK